MESRAFGRWDSMIGAHPGKVRSAALANRAADAMAKCAFPATKILRRATQDARGPRLLRLNLADVVGGTPLAWR